MSNIIIKKETGFTVDNLPPEVLTVLERVENDRSGDLVVSVRDDNSAQYVMSVIGSTNAPVQFLRRPDNSYLCYRQDPMTTYNVPPTFGFMPIGGGGGGGGNPGTIVGGGGTGVGLARQRQAAAYPTRIDPATMPQMRAVEPPTAARLNEMLNAQAATLRQRLDEAMDPVDEPEQEDVGFQMRPVTEHRIPTELHGNAALGEIAKCLHNTLSSNASVANSKIQELEKIMKRSIILQNEIDLLMNPVIENEKVQSIQHQIEAINTSGGDIRKAYITESGSLVVLTNRLSTFPVQDEGVAKVFDVGEMQIDISLSLMLAQTDPGAVASVKIKNLTHELVDGGEVWECGHTKKDSICLGSVFNQVHQAFVEKNLILAVECILRFIKNPNPKDAWGCKILKFPRIGGNDN